MPPPKRRAPGGRPVHDGRVAKAAAVIRTDDDVRTRVVAPPDAPAPRADRGAAAPHPIHQEVAPTARTTSRRPPVRIRPAWHKWLGIALLLFGVALLVLNDLMMLQPSLLLLPGGHNELYLFAAVLIGGYSTWWFGWFDRTR